MLQGATVAFPKAKAISKKSSASSSTTRQRRKEKGEEEVKRNECPF